MGKVSNKNGNIEILFLCIASIFVILTFLVIFVLYSQINISVYSVKYDIYNIVQNVFVCFDKEELAYDNYVLNENEMSEKIQNIISLNYDNVKLKYLSYDKEENEVDITVTISIKPVTFISKIDIEIKERIKLKLMEVNFSDEK